MSVILLWEGNTQKQKCKIAWKNRREGDAEDGWSVLFVVRIEFCSRERRRLPVEDDDEQPGLVFATRQRKIF